MRFGFVSQTGKWSADLGHTSSLTTKRSIRPLVKSVYRKIIFLKFSTKKYVVGAQKNRLNETVLLSTQNIS